METGNLDPISDYANFCDNMNQHVKEVIKELNPKLQFWENPRAGLRKMTWMSDLPRYTVTYCFSGDTKIITKNGTIPIGELCGKEVELLSKNGQWIKSSIDSFGKQKLFKLTLSRAKKKKDIYVTKDHKWILKDGSVIKTSDLFKGQVLEYVKTNHVECQLIDEYVARGFTYGDGWILNNKQICFCEFVNEKQEMLKYFNNLGGKRWHDDVGNLSIVKLCSLPTEFKNSMPSVNEDKSKIFSWLAGYIAADGSVHSKNGQITLSSSNKENLECVRDLCTAIGIDTYSIVPYMRKGYGKEQTPLYQMTFMRSDVPRSMILRSKHLKNFDSISPPKHQARRWTVVSVEETDRIEDVYCANVPDTHMFALEDGILTHNCQYGFTFMKPTDIWTNHPNPKFKPPCKNGDTCHERAPRGSRNGLQGVKGADKRSMYPPALCEHIVDICEEYMSEQNNT